MRTTQRFGAATLILTDPSRAGAFRDEFRQIVDDRHGEWALWNPHRTDYLSKGEVLVTSEEERKAVMQLEAQHNDRGLFKGLVHRLLPHRLYREAKSLEKILRAYADQHAERVVLGGDRTLNVIGLATEARNRFLPKLGNRLPGRMLRAVIRYGDPKMWDHELQRQKQAITDFKDRQGN